MAEKKSFADVFDSTLTDWKRFASFLLMVFCVGVIVFLAFLLIGKYSGSSIKEINISTTGPKVIFGTTSAEGRKEYILVVHPQGWQNTGIHIDEGSTVSFKADGRVNIDGGGLVRTVLDRKKLEEEITKEHNLDPYSDAEDQTPEHYFSPEQIESTMLQRPWVDPDGFAPNTKNEQTLQITYGNRRSRLELPDENLGCLVGRIGEEGKRSKVFRIGKKLESYKAEVTGDLWLNVNDVKNLQPDLKQQMFYQDNVGFFWVVVNTK